MTIALSLCALVATTLAAPAALAVPSDGTIMKQLKKKAPKGAKIKFSGKRGKPKREIEGNWEVSNFYRWYDQVTKTEHPGVTAHYHGGIKYGYRDGKWRFLNLLIGDTTYKGIPDPKWSELEPLFTGNLEGALGFAYKEVVSVEKMRLADDPDWQWHKPTSVEFRYLVTYTRKANATDLEHSTKEFKVHLRSESFQGPWNPEFRASRTPKKAVVHSRKTLSREELAAIRTLLEAELERASLEEIAKLPKVTLPPFADHAAFRLYIEDMLLSADGPTIEATLRQILPSGWRHPAMKTVLNQQGRAFIERVKKDALVYRQQYCTNPAMKHQQKNMSEWLNKAGSAYSRFRSSDRGGGRRVIGELNLGLKQGAEGEALSKASCKVRGNPITRMKGTKLQAKVGAMVFVQWRGGGYWYAARLTGSAGGKYQVQYLDGSKGAELPQHVINFDLQPGDEVVKKHQGKHYLYWVTQVSGETVRVENAKGKQHEVALKDLKFR